MAPHIPTLSTFSGPWQDIIVSGVFVLAYMVGGISLSASADDWREIDDDHSDPPARFGRIATALGAASVSGGLATPTLQKGTHYSTG